MRYGAYKQKVAGNLSVFSMRNALGECGPSGKFKNLISYLQLFILRCLGLARAHHARAIAHISLRRNLLTGGDMNFHTEYLSLVTPEWDSYFFSLDRVVVDKI